MQLRYVDSDVHTHETPLLAVAITEEADASSSNLAALDQHLSGALARALASGDMRGRRSDELVLFGDGGGPSRVVLLGVGKAASVDAEGIRRMAGRAVRAAERFRIDAVSISLEGLEAMEAEGAAQAAAEGAGLAAWRFDELKAKDEDDPAVEVRAVDLVGGENRDALATGALAGAAIARGANLARTLQSRPGNVATPTHIADEAVRMCGSVGLEVTVFDEVRLLEEGMHALLSVSRGSAEEARFIIM